MRAAHKKRKRNETQDNRRKHKIIEEKETGDKKCYPANGQ